MKLQRTIMVFLIAALLVITPLSLLAGKGGGKSSNKVKPPTVELSAWESDLLFMREEEKLARDVYREMYDKWGAPIFSNISEAEQSHMDALGRLVEKYGLTDPVTNDDTGVFTSFYLSTLYQGLVYDGNDFGSAGMESLEAALLVGALIEEVDIKDIEEAMAIKGSPADVIRAYENLLEGSYNHLRAFVGQLKSMTGDEYEARILTQDEVDDILDDSVKSRRGR